MLAVMDGAAQRAFHPAQLALAIVQVKPVGAILDRQRGVEVAVTVEVAEHRIERVQLGRGGDMGRGRVDEGRTGARLRKSRAGEEGGGDDDKYAHGRQVRVTWRSPIFSIEVTILSPGLSQTCLSGG
jgi:hypothetical protein